MYIRNNYYNQYRYRNNTSSYLKDNTGLKERLTDLKETLTKEMEEIQNSNLDPKVKEFKVNLINKKLKDVDKGLEPFKEKPKTNSNKASKNQGKLTKEELLEQLSNSDPRILFRNPWLAKKLSQENFEGLKMPTNLKARFRERPSQVMSRSRFTYNNPHLRGIYW